jgi:hypothetical protein
MYTHPFSKAHTYENNTYNLMEVEKNFVKLYYTVD